MKSCVKYLNDCATAIRCLNSKSALALAAFPLLLLVSLAFTGCGNHVYSYPAQGSGINGAVIGGQNPVTASTIQLYAVGSTGDGSAATALIAATLTTSDGTSAVNSNANPGNANNTLPAGSFTIPALSYTCPTSTTEVYMVSKGGNPGLGTGVNANLTLMTALGQCGNLTPSTYIVMNELTTVSSLAALSNFATSYSSLGSGSTDLTQLQSQFSEVTEYTNTANGTVPGPALPAGYSASSTAVQTLGDIVAACINSAGGVAGDGSPCGNLFTLATISGNPAPTDTVGAVLNILNQPTVNVSQIFALLPSNNPFVPTLSNAPANWQLPISSNTAAKLAFTVQPSDTAAGSPISPVVTVSIEDGSGTVQTSATNAVTLALGANPSNGTLSGTTTVSAVNGVATFTGININKTGTGYTLTAASTALTGTASGTFNITPGGVSKLAFGVQPPASTAAGASMAPPMTVLVEDGSGNTVTTSTATVLMAIGTNPSSGALGGTLSVNAVAGVATFPGLSINNVGTGYTLAASSTGLTGTTSNPFNITGAAITVSPTTVGNNFITTLNLSLPTAAPATELMTVTSNDPTHFLLSTSLTAVGTASLTVQLTQGSGSVPAVYLQGQNYSGTTAITNTVTASASGFANGTGTQTLYPSGLGFYTSSFSTTTQATPTTLTVGLEVLNPGSLTAASQGTLGPQGASPSFTVTSGTLATGTITGNPSTFTVGSGNYNSGLSFQPVGAGTSTLSINQPAGYSNPVSASWPVSITATVTAPTINVPANSVVGNSFVASINIGLQSAPKSADTFTITSSDPTHFLLSTSSTVVGSASLMIPVGIGGSIPTIYLEGQNYTGNGSTATTATLTVTDSSNAYTPGSGTLSLYPSGVALYTSSFSTTTQSSPTTLTAAILALTPGTLASYAQGTLGPQASTINYTITSGTPATGTVSNSGNGSFPPGTSNYSSTVTFQPLTGGTSTISIAEPAGYFVTTSTSSWPTSITATVSAPTINPQSVVVGNNFVNSLSVSLQSPPNAADTFTISTNDVGSHFLFSTNGAVVGTPSLAIPVAKNGSIPTIYIQGQNYSGSTAITATLTVTDSLNAYSSGTSTVTLYPSGVGFYTSSVNTTTFSSPTTLTVGLLTLNPGTLTSYGQGTLGPQGVSPTTTVTSGTLTTGTISGSPATFTVNSGVYSNSGLTFVPVGAGTSTLTITEPAGYYAVQSPNWPLQITATVTAPTITVSPTTVGNNFITNLNLSIQAAPPTTETMTITSNDPTHFLLSTSPTVVGSASIMVTLTAGSGSVPNVYLQGQNFNNNATAWTTSVTATASGYTGGSGTQTLYPSGLGFYTSSFGTAKSGSPTGLTVGLLGLTPGTLTAAFQGTLGPQGASPSFTVTSGTLTTGTISGNPGNYTINGSTYNNSGLTFVPVGDGTSTLTLNQPAGYTASTSSNWPTQITATVTGP